MSITDPQFGEETNQIAGAIDVFGRSSDFIGGLDDIINGRNLINDIINADLVDINLDGSLNFDVGSGMSLADQIAAETTTLVADNALAQIKEELETEVAKIQANTVLSDEQKKVRIAQLANDWLVETGAPNAVKAEVMTSVWSELGEEVNLTAEGYEKLPYAGASSPYGVREDEGGLIDLTVPTTDEAAGGGGASSSTTVDAGGSPAAGGGGSVVTASQAESAQQAAAAAAAATANDPNAAEAAEIVNTAIENAGGTATVGSNQSAGGAVRDVGAEPKLRDTYTDPDGTVWTNTGPALPTGGVFNDEYNVWRTNNPSPEVIAQYEAATGETYDPNGRTVITFQYPRGQWPNTGTSTGDQSGDPNNDPNAGTGNQNNQNNQDNQDNQDGNGLLENAAAILGGLSAAVLNNADPYDVPLPPSDTSTSTDGTGTSNTTTTLGDCPEGQMRSPYSGNCVTDYSEVDFTNNGNGNTDGTGNDNGNDGTGTCPPGTKLAGQAKPADGNCNPGPGGGTGVCAAGTELAGQLTPADGNCNPGDGDDVCGAGTKLAGQLVPADGNCNPGPGGTGFCPTGTILAGQAIPADGNCNPSSGEGPGNDPGTGGTGGGSGGSGDVYNLFAQTARTPTTLTVLENRGLDYELTPLLSRVLNI